jgi:hypothetical protein
MFIAQVMSPTINYEAGTVAKFPIVIDEKSKDIVEKCVDECIVDSRADYDAFETSWDFKKHPLI